MSTRQWLTHIPRRVAFLAVILAPCSPTKVIGVGRSRMFELMAASEIESVLPDGTVPLKMVEMMASGVPMVVMQVPVGVVNEG